MATPPLDFDRLADRLDRRWPLPRRSPDRAWTRWTARNVSPAPIEQQDHVRAPRSPRPRVRAAPRPLLVSSAGATSAADPAIEYTGGADEHRPADAAGPRPSGTPAQVVRIYRNSREDVWSPRPRCPASPSIREITVDALAGRDRSSSRSRPRRWVPATSRSAVRHNTGAVSLDCQLALSFSARTATRRQPVRRRSLVQRLQRPDDPARPRRRPFVEQGQAADITPDRYYEGTAILDRHRRLDGPDVGQSHDALVDPYGAWVFSDEDLNAGGGLGA